MTSSSSRTNRLAICGVLIVSLLLMAGNGKCGPDECNVGDEKTSLIYVLKDAKNPKSAELTFFMITGHFLSSNLFLNLVG